MLDPLKSFRFIHVVRPYQQGLVEYLGKYQRTVGAGLTITIPFLQRLTKIDMREHVVDVPPQAVITKDNVAVEVDAVIYYMVNDPVRVVYNVAKFYNAITKLAQTSLRNLIGDLSLDETLTSREVINSQLRQILDDATDKWGTKVTRVELQRIEPPRDVTEAMHRQMKAERDRRATILEAEGKKQSEILRAEGHKQAAVLQAEGDAEAVRTRAEAERFRQETVAAGEALAISQVFKAIGDSEPDETLLALKYMETLEKMAEGQATKIFMPMEATSALGSLAAAKEIFSSNGKVSSNGHS